MKAIICEYLWQMDYIGRKPDALLVSVSPDMSYQLIQRGRPFKECSELCLHKELWAKYPGFVDNFFTLTARLDEILWDVDPRFRDMNWPIFDRLGYMLMISYNQSVYYAHLIRELTDLGVDTVACPDNGGPIVDQYGLFTADRSVFPEVVRSFGDDGPVLEILASPLKTKPFRSPIFSFGQPKQLAKKLGAESVFNALYNLKFILKFNPMVSGKVRTVLSVGCKEVDALDSAKLHGVRLLKFHPYLEYTDNQTEWPHFHHFLDRVIRDEDVNRLLRYRRANLLNLLLPCIRFLANKLEFMLEKRAKLNEYLDRRNVDFVVFHTMAPFYPPNVIVYEWCKERNVPFACWMHGGYGAYESLQGYDVTDYRLSSQHLVYGQILANLQSNPDWILHKLGYADRLEQIRVMGSPFFEEVYSKYQRPENKHRKILFCLGNYNGHNQFYFGHNRPNSELSIWKIHKRIFEELASFQDQYDIVIKDYPNSPQTEMWLRVLRDIGADKIKYISHERPFSDVLVEADLHIFSWISTTFFQSLYTDADICLFDNTDLTNESRSIFKQNIIFSSDLEEFCGILTNYLKQGEFYIQNKNFLKEHFVDSCNQGRRAEQFEFLVESLVRKRR